MDNVVEQIKPFDPYRRVEAETMSWGYGLKTKRMDEENKNSTKMFVTNIDDGEHIKVSGVKFGNKGARKFYASVATDSLARIEIRLDSPDGPLAGTLPISPTGGESQYHTVSCKLKPRLRGTHDLYFVFRGTGKNLFNFDWWRFK